MRKADREKLRENCVRARERRSSFQYLIPVYQFLPGLPYDWSIVTVYFIICYFNYLTRWNEKLFFKKWAGSWATSLLFRFSRSSTLTGSLAQTRLNEKRPWRWIKSDLIIRLLCHYLDYLNRSWRLMMSQEPFDEFLVFVNLTVCICAGNRDSRRTTQ